MKNDIGILLIRLGFGGLMLFSHGLPKLLSFSEKMNVFPDPLGIGSSFSMALAIFSEFFCSLAVILGFHTRYASLPLVITMGVAAFIFHSDDPWSKQEFPLLYAVSFIALFFLGSGRFSLDGILRGRKSF